MSNEFTKKTNIEIYDNSKNNIHLNQKEFACDFFDEYYYDDVLIPTQERILINEKKYTNISFDCEDSKCTKLGYNIPFELVAPYRDDLNLCRPYLSKKARQFLRHAGYWEELEKLENHIIHVDFTGYEAFMLSRLLFFLDDKQIEERINSFLPGRTIDDCKRFLNDYPDFKTPYDSIAIKVLPKGPERSVQDDRAIKSNLMNLFLQRQCGGRIHPKYAKNISNDIDSKIIHFLRPHKFFDRTSGDVIDLAFDSLGKKFAFGCSTTQDEYNREGNLVICDMESETCTVLMDHKIITNENVFYPTVSNVKFSADGLFLFSGAFDSTVKVWSRSGHLLNSFKDSDGKIDMMATHPTNPRILSVSSHDRLTHHFSLIKINSFFSNIHLYRLNEDGLSTSYTKLGTINHNFYGSAMTFGNHVLDHFLVVGYENIDESKYLGTAIVFDITKETFLKELKTEGTSHTSVFAHEFSNYFITGSNTFKDGRIRVYTAKDWSIVIECYSPQKDINQVTLSPCLRYLTSSGTDCCTYIWDTRKPDIPLHILRHGKTKLVYSDSANSEDLDSGTTVSLWSLYAFGFITGGSDGYLKLWNLGHNEPFVSDIIEVDSAITAACMSPDEDIFVVGESTGHITVLSTQSTGSITSFCINSQTNSTSKEKATK
ncbi:uncharacterized protein T551_01972 [Pneumocystis jirovecii RU7]|uniref:Uncharacterized protein n=1 Tax=Pneumocystis jirovecii (strain RU7) TaxID=1408657 RepID=A0A0W4ZNS7_PNEJ7|nr:uncharacterized protein T551_01972 [Pneumocystis jirovecii RU7]KTW30028.1 hypothetical protein T551_01972 [Pneumocystis jirovecii RU7]